TRPQRLAIDTGPDGVTRLEQAGWVTLPDPVGGRLALWWLGQYGGGLFLPPRGATARGATPGGGPGPLRHAQSAPPRSGRLSPLPRRSAPAGARPPAPAAPKMAVRGGGGGRRPPP